MISLQGSPDVIEEVEAPLPVFISIDPTFKSHFTTVSQRLAFQKYQKTATQKAKNFKEYLKVFNAKELGVDETLVGLPGSPTIVYKVERVPKSTATRQAEIIDGSDPAQLQKVVGRMKEALSAMVIK
jgi:electron transfer flavoprotein beta subunit